MIRWGAEGLASGQDRELRTKIENLVKERGVGKALRSGVAMGWMFIWIEVSDKEKGRRDLENIMKEVAPGIPYRIESGSALER